MINFILLILFVSILLYVILAGADLGAGILEIFRGEKLRSDQEKLITKAMGPVWEANHIWLILIIVILFVGFPKSYRNFSIVFHIPITMVLIGIVFRGAAFTFRHYDAVKGESQKYYSWIFGYSSLWTTMWMGIIVGAMVLGSVRMTGSFYEVYIASWLQPFPVMMGCFLCSLFSYVAATFLVAESKTFQVRELFKSRVIYSNVVSVMIGAILFVYSFYHDVIILKFFSNIWTIALFSISTFILFIQWWAIKREKNKLLKFFGVIQLSSVLLGWGLLQFPYLYFNADSGKGHSLLLNIAPVGTQEQLVIALLIGVILIFPPYIYLMRIFKSRI